MAMTKKKKKIISVVLAVLAFFAFVPILSGKYVNGNGQAKDLTGVVRTGLWTVKIDNGNGDFWVGTIGLFGRTINWKLTSNGQTDVWTKA